MTRTDRLGLLQLARVVMAGVTIAAVSTIDSLSTGRWHAAPTLVAWVLLSFVADAARRTAHRDGIAVPIALLVVDAVVLAFVLANTGGHHSPLVGLVYLHVVAVSLLVSPRLALRVSVLHGLLLFGGFAAAASHSFGLRLDGTVADAGALAGLHATGFLLVAIGVAAGASLNEQGLRRSQRELAAIAEASGVLNATLDVELALELAVESVRRTLTSGRVVAAITDASIDGWRAAVADSSGTVYAFGAGPLPRRDEVELHQVLDEDLEALLPAATNVVVAPLRAGGVDGLLLVEIGGSATTRLPESTVTTIASIATVLGTTIDNARLHQRIEYLATRDGLTGLPNRRVFDELLADEVRRARRDGIAFSVVMLDVDHFKSVNDGHGHQVGDEVLQRVAAGLAEAVRESDLVARYGGEEFVALLRGCDAKHALAVADALRRAGVVPDGTVAVTVSAGVATFPPQALDANGLLEAADGALYAAKRGGRDQTRQAPSRLRLVEKRSA
jgi:diguanylate cyclase (GGDEF)-like protein